jgi:MATE family multidrug resistance protein
MPSLPWSDHPFRGLLRLAWPIAVSNLSYSVMTVVDTLLVGRLGTAELAGVGFAGMVNFVLLCFSIGLLQGAKTLTAQALGAGRRDAVLGYVGAALVVGFSLGVLTAGLGLFVAPLLARMSATEAAGRAASTYLAIRTLAAPLVLAHAGLRETRQALGDARSPMIATIVANVVNVALAVVFLFVLRWGVAGAALAAAIAHAIELGVLAAAQAAAGGFGLRTVGRHHFRELWHMGLPTALQFMLEVGSFATLTLAVAGFSEMDMAAHQIAIQVAHFSFMPCVAVGEAAAILTGQAVGADRDDLVRNVGRRAAALAMAHALACSVVMLVLGRAIAARFTTDPAVIALAARLFQVAAAFGVIDAVNIVSRCVLRGAGDVRFAARVGTAVAWICTPTMAWGLGRGLRLGALGGWLGILLEIIVSTAFFASRALRGGWKAAALESRKRLHAVPSTVNAAGPFSAAPSTG